MKTSTIIIVLVVVVVIIVAGVYYFVSQSSTVTEHSKAQGVTLTSKASVGKPLVPLTPVQQSAEINKDYPKTITGVINFSDTKGSYKATIIGDDGKEYTLYPPSPDSIYESFGVRAGQKVQIQGRINGQGNLEWAGIKPI